MIEQYLKFMSKDANIEDKSDYELVPNEIIKNYKEELYIELSYEKILNQFIEKYKINHEDLVGRPKNRKISTIKQEFIKTVINNKVISQRELADNLRVS